MTDAAERVEQIERQVDAARRMVRATLRQFIEGPGNPVSDDDPSQKALTVSAGDLERYATEWTWLAPTDAVQRQELTSRLTDRFGAEVLNGPATRRALQLPPLDAPPFMADLEGGSAVDLLERSGACVAIKGGDTLLRQGELSADFYVVLTGRLAAAQSAPEGGERVLREMVRGTSIGEMAALTGQPRAARVFALRDSHLLRVSRAGFERAIARFPELLRGVVLTLVAREREGLRHERRPATRTLAMLPIGARAPAMVQTFAHSLADELRQYGSTRLVGPTEAAASPPGAFQGWLDGLEETHRLVIYVADPDASEWTARCMRQADQILLV
ncbi:MAG TPA: cyclic nucleotide-binding domain-containing protein, partial [Chloroflexota bacterium]